MDWGTRAKLGLMLAAGIVFAGSMWTEQEWLRYVAIGLLLVALIVRFIRPGRPRGDDA
ncbi:MAG: hypothetical protein JO180_04735 [Gemmatirosa sp.]|nr:hypothetical protein [Gemmatirosa sp.]